MPVSWLEPSDDLSAYRISKESTSSVARRRPRVAPVVTWLLRHNKAFLEVCGNGDISGAEKLLRKGADINARDTRDIHSSGTALNFAVQDRNVLMVRWLLKNEANVESNNCFGLTPLLAAAQLGDLDIVRILLDSGANIESLNGQNHTALILACISGKERAMQLLLENGANIEASDQFNFTALQAAARTGNEVALTTLLEHGVNMERTFERDTPLLAALSRGHDGAAQVLIEAGANVNAKRAKSETRAVHLAAANACFGALRQLSERGADLDLTDERGFAALDYAVVPTILSRPLKQTETLYS